MTVIKVAEIHGDPSNYSIPEQAQKVFEDGVLQNPLIAKDLPKDYQKYAEKIHFKGTKFPYLAVNWRFAESISALKALEGVFLNALLVEKYNVEPQEIVVDTDHALLFIMSCFLWEIDPHAETPITGSTIGKSGGALMYPLFKNCDYHDWLQPLHRGQATNIFKTKDGRFFHIHGSLDPVPMLDFFGFPHHHPEIKTFEEAIVPFAKAVSEYDSADLQEKVDRQVKAAGTICWTPDEYAESEHGKANEHIGLYEIFEKSNPKQKPTWWKSSPQTGVARPLAGLKVIDLCRVIAAPAVTRGLAEWGASVLRIAAPHVPDASQLHPDLHWGKWNAHLDLRQEEDRQTLRNLILEADVVVQGYRPDVMEKYGFGCDDIVELCKDREYGIIVARENCYGWKGPWSFRSGWQQISDANSGVSMEFGRAMGNDEPVTPVLPNSDYCTGVTGLCGIIDAILRRSKKGGSWKVDIALNHYSSWLVKSVGVYPAEVWDRMWEASGRNVFRHYHNMFQIIPTYMNYLRENAKDKLLKDEFFIERESGAIGKTMRFVSPVLEFPKEQVKLGFNVGTRGNGVDKARWPEDLMTEVIV